MESIFGWPAGRGELTIILAHSTFCMAYVTVVVRSRLADLDLSLEEAAQDLGATPARVFFDITLPIIAPALISGWLLSFTLSLDDLVIASFVSGPGSTHAADGDLLEDQARRLARRQRARQRHHRHRRARRRRRDDPATAQETGPGVAAVRPRLLGGVPLANPARRQKYSSLAKARAQSVAQGAVDCGVVQDYLSIVASR